MKLLTKLLFIEDNPGDARLLREMLNENASQPTHITHVGTMHEAELFLAENHADMILLDLGLPDAEGLDAVRRVRLSAPRVPLVVLTGSDDDELASRALHEGSQDYLVKGQIDGRVLSRTFRHSIERKMMELELDEIRILAIESSRLKAEFLANMSHEIRTPMSGVVGLTELLLEGNLEPQQRDYLEMIRSSGESLLMLINDILDFSKIESGFLRFENIEFDLRTLSDLTISMLSKRAESKDLLLTSEILDGVPGHLRGDPGRLRQILSNLIGNAIKFTEEGSITLSISAVSQTSDNAMLRFEVRDTGIGISKASREFLFEAFIQADSSTTRKYGGTGLGLAISKQLVEFMGGQIGIESNPAGGTVFWFTASFEKFPDATAGLSPIAATLNGPVSEQRPDANRSPGDLKIRSTSPAPRIILAEDNVINQMVALGQLRLLGYAAEVVSNGVELLEKLKKRPADIVLMDCNMPEMDGFAATREIRRREGDARHTIVIAMTANALEGDREKCLASGMDDYLSKPVKVDVLGQKLRQWIGSVNKSAKPPNTLNRERLRPDEARPVIDIAVLAELKELQQPDSPDFVTELIDVYLSDSMALLEKLSAAVSVGDIDEVRRLAHLMKSSSSNMGATRMAELYHALETNTMSSDRKNGEQQELLIQLELEFLAVGNVLKTKRFVAEGATL